VVVAVFKGGTWSRGPLGRRSGQGEVQQGLERS
jgi:hypothetical protein